MAAEVQTIQSAVTFTGAVDRVTSILVFTEAQAATETAIFTQKDFDTTLKKVSKRQAKPA
mgnify:CR=1 FL=1